MRIKPWYHVMTALGALLLLGATIFAALRWNTLPEQIPTGFDGAGLPNEYGGKSSLIALLGVGWLMFLVVTVISFFPQTWNTGAGRGFLRLRFRVFPTRQRGPQAMQAMADMLAFLRLILAAVFSWTCLCIVRSAPLGVWFLPTLLGTLGLDLAVCAVRIIRAGQS